MGAPKGRGLVIAVAGLHGSGRSTQARRLAESLGLRYVSTGIIFRERARERGITLEELNLLAGNDPELDNYLDARTKEESKRGGVVIDANLSAWMAVEPDIRIYLTAPFDVRMRRIAEREGRPLSEVERETRVREESEGERYRRYYGVDVSDLGAYDVVLNTALFDIGSTANILKKIVEEYCSGG
jgi:cytidylate kinase